MLVFGGYGVEIETLSFHVDARLICANPDPHLGGTCFLITSFVASLLPIFANVSLAELF